MNIVSQFYRRTILACIITAAVETALVLSLVEPPILLFVLGPLAFLALIATRRKTHLVRIRRLHGAAVGIGMFGIASLGAAFLFRRNDPQGEALPLAPAIVPLVQWFVVLFVWVSIARAEAREKPKPP